MRKLWKWFRVGRCTAVLSRNDSEVYYGRCELRGDHPGLHELDRGMVDVRWSVNVY